MSQERFAQGPSLLAWKWLQAVVLTMCCHAMLPESGKKQRHRQGKYSFLHWFFLATWRNGQLYFALRRAGLKAFLWLFHSALGGERQVHMNTQLRQYTRKREHSEQSRKSALRKFLALSQSSPVIIKWLHGYTPVLARSFRIASYIMPNLLVCMRLGEGGPVS